jgi:4-hydroxy-tetrahydrodipicolinate reductase
MKLALIGYGKMGKEIESVALSRGHDVVLRINRSNIGDITGENLRRADAAIEFTIPSSAIANLDSCFDAGIPVVCGTTGWHQRIEEVRQSCIKQNGTLFYASNFSIGMNIFFRINSLLARMMNGYPEYEVSLEEIHHIHKLDRPSGTAISLANQILSVLKRKTSWSLDEKGDKILPITEKREGEVPGTHIVRYRSPIDDIEIMHMAHSRKGFALGAVLAAEFIVGKKGIYTMEDLLPNGS